MSYVTQGRHRLVLLQTQAFSMGPDTHSLYAPPHPLTHSPRLTTPDYDHTHKVHIYVEYYSVCPLFGIGNLPTPLSPASVPLPPEPKGGGAHSPTGEGLGESQFRRLERKLSTLPMIIPKGPWQKIGLLALTPTRPGKP